MLAYIATSTSIEIYDLSQITPLQIGFLNTTGYGPLNQLILSSSESIAYVGYTNGFMTVNITDLTKPTVAGNLKLTNTVWDVVVDRGNKYAYLANGLGGIAQVSVKNPQDLVLTAQLNSSSDPPVYGISEFMIFIINISFRDCSKFGDGFR